MPKGTTKTLTNKVKNETALFGKQSGHTYFVYVHETYGVEKIDKARAELDKIKKRPYHPKWHQLPRAYRKHKDHPIAADSEERLAQVLHDAGVLEERTVAALHKKISTEGTLFATCGGSTFTLYLSDTLKKRDVERVQQILNRKRS